MAALAPVEELQQSLGEDRPISRFDTGIIVQAGAYPN
ncbi:hypothetical protein [Paracoccus halophilus]